MATISIAGRVVGGGQPCFVIGEAGVNHNGDLSLAKRLVQAGAKAGVDAVKFQTFQSAQLVAPGAPKADYQKQATGASESQLDMIRRLELPSEAFAELQAECRRCGVVFLSTAFDVGSADLLARLNVAAMKIPSGEITNWPFLEYVARQGRPVIMSTGMCYLSEVDEAIRIVRRAGCEDLAILHCVSSYPTEPADANLRAMESMKAAFGVPVGYSDHTEGLEVSLAAVAMGACIIEKHFTLDRSMPGPDHKASLEPDGLKEMVCRIRSVEASLGHGRKEPVPAELGVMKVARRSLAAARRLNAGCVITRDCLTALRPGTGIPPAAIEQTIGRRLKADVEAGTLLEWDMLA